MQDETFLHYRNNVGIEPYYTYNTMGAGHGTAYLADATGQLKVVKEVASYYRIREMETSLVSHR